MSPSVVVDAEDRVVAVVGASGGSKIITAVAQTLFRVLYLGDNVKQAVDARRLHHQLFPMNLNYEDGITTVRSDGSCHILKGYYYNDYTFHLIIQQSDDR